MSTREFTETRTMLANAMATAGAELLEYMGTAGALAAIPNTEPQQYVVAGTLAMIGKLLPTPAAAGIEGLTRYAPRVNLLDGIAWMEDDAGGGYVKFADVERLLGAHAPVAAKLTDERIKQVARDAVAARLLSWTGFEEDERGFYTVPVLSPCHYQFARAIEGEVLAHAGVEAAELPAILFDGHSVFQEITSHLGKGHCYSPDAVSATLDAIVRLMRKALATPSPQSHAAVSEQTAAEQEKLLRAALDAAEKWSQQEHLHARDIGRGGPGSLKKVERAEREARAAITALATKEAAAAVAPSQWISVDERLPEKECLAVYVTPNGRQRLIRAKYTRQFQIEAEGDDQCETEYNDDDDTFYIKAGWLECIDNWGEYSSCYVTEGTVTHWMPLPAAPSTADSAGTGAMGEKGAEA